MEWELSDCRLPPNAIDGRPGPGVVRDLAA